MTRTGADHLRVEHGSGISRLTLARPDAANTVNLSLARSLVDAIRGVEQRRSRVVILAADGRAFCAGGDVKEMAEAVDSDSYLAELAGTFHDALRRLNGLDAVTIAAVDGAAAGGGLGLALTADVIVAGERARFLTAYGSIGLTPDSGVSWLLPHVIGLSRAQAMSTLDLNIDAPTALSWGLVARVVPSDQLDTTVSALAERLAQRPTGHLADTRRLYRSAGGYEQALDAERESIARSSTHEPAVTALQEFSGRAANRDNSPKSE